MSYLVVHGHFYQPPREDPASGLIPQEYGAEPFSNFNEKINAECYRPNAELGNFERLSFDLGPTLARWLKAMAPEVHRRIVASDKKIARRFGSGGGMAQSYHHSILPLATPEEKELEIAWGLADFAQRFGRRSRGLWLPETAVDLATLDEAARQGIELVVLAPWQARDPDLDPSQPYWVELPSGRRIAAFFFAKHLSGRLSFDARTSGNAESFARDHLAPLNRHFRRAGRGNGLVLIATDGELYGHHQAGREEFLKALLHQTAATAGFVITHLDRYLDHFPPRQSVELVAPSAWSCYHGVDRWARECPCTPGASWKAPLRELFGRLATALDAAFGEAASQWVDNPRGLLLDSVALLTGKRSLGRLLAEHASGKPTTTDRERLGDLLFAQRLRYRMFASCAWFWSELDRIEPHNAIRAAVAASFLTQRATGSDPAPWLLDELATVHSARSSYTAAVTARDELAKLRQAASSGRPWSERLTQAVAAS